MAKVRAFFSTSRTVSDPTRLTIPSTNDMRCYRGFLRPRLTGSGGVSGFATGKGGGGFDLRFNLSRNARCAFRLGEAPRTVGFSIGLLLSCRFSSLPVRFYPTDWRHPLVRLSFAMVSETIELRGHIIDSLILPKVLDQILTRGATFKIAEIKIGQKRADQSFARIEVSAETSEALDELILRLRQHGAEVAERAEAQLGSAPADG